MSAPVGLVDTAVAAVQEQAVDLGVAWQIRLATVAQGDDPSLVKLRMDGDATASVTAVTFGISMVGPLTIGARVYVMSVPPAGQYVVGVVGSDITGSLLGYGKRETNSTGTTTEVGVLRLDNLHPVFGRRYLIHTGTALGDSTVANDVASSFLRIDTTGAAATTVSTLIQQCPDVQVNAASPVNLAVEVSRTPAAAGEVWSVLLSVVRVSGTGTVVMIAGATFPVELFVEDLGPDPGDTGVLI